MEIFASAQGFVVGFLTIGREMVGRDRSTSCGEVELDGIVDVIELVMLNMWISSRSISRSRKVEVC